VRFLGTIYTVTNLVPPLRESPGLSRCHQVDFPERLDIPDFPLYALTLSKGDLLVLLRNLDPAGRLAKGRRCSAQDLRNRALVISLEDGNQRTLTRIPLEKVSNGMRFKWWQVPLRLIFPGTVHRSQGMTLDGAVVDCRS
jgi:hypothetical protein